MVSYDILFEKFHWFSDFFARRTDQQEDNYFERRKEFSGDVSRVSLVLISQQIRIFILRTSPLKQFHVRICTAKI